MKAAVFHQHGGPDVLRYEDRPPPLPQAGEVLVRVKACALNHLDIWIRQGIPAFTVALPHIGGCDVAGLVEQVGDGVVGWFISDPQGQAREASEPAARRQLLFILVAAPEASKRRVSYLQIAGLKRQIDLLPVGKH